LNGEGMKKKKRPRRGLPRKGSANLFCELHWWKEHCIEIGRVKKNKT
jgi:hypothetical protein